MKKSLLEPRGLVRVLQFIFAIFAFATACNGRSSVALDRPVGNDAITASWSYPYNLKTSFIQNKSGDLVSISDANDVKPSAEFFVFTGVTAMLISLAFIIIYVVLDRQYRNDERLPMIDFILCIIWSIFWLAGSAAWAKGVSNIRTLTSADEIRRRSGLCEPATTCLESSCKRWMIFCVICNRLSS